MGIAYKNLNMKNLFFLFSIILLLTICISCGGGEVGGQTTGDFSLNTQMDSMYYAVGAEFSKAAQRSKITLNIDEVRKGYTECESGTSYLNPKNLKDYMTLWQEEYKEKMAESTDDPIDMNFDSLSYVIGCSYFIQLNERGLELKGEPLLKGVADNVTEGSSLLDDQQIASFLENFRSYSEMSKAKKKKAEAAANKEKGKAFLSKKAKEAGVKSTGSGLLYKVVKHGSGFSPQATDKVAVYYEGRLMDGSVFDSSSGRGRPSEFALNNVIKGWTEGLQLMSPGAKFQFYIPANLAYGEKGYPPRIGPNETLVFDIELMKIIKPESK